MTTDASITETTREISKLWASNHPALFSESVLEFLDTHKQPEWFVEVNSNIGFMFFKATRAKATNGQA